MDTFVKPRVRGNAMTLESRWFTSQEVFEREQVRLFASRWICVGRVEQLPNAGDYFLVAICGESLILTRDKSGEVHAFYNVCRHRGTRMCTHDTGHLSGSIQCPYHGWTYALNGKLIAARNMNEVDGFDPSRFSLREAAVAHFEGFLFVNLSERPESFDRAFAPLLGRFSDWHIAELRTAQAITYELACNWKLVFLNYSECYHCPLVHPQLEKLSPSDSGRNDLSEGPFLGGYSEVRAPGVSLTTTGRTNRPPLGTVRGANLDRMYYYTIFPSMLLSLHPDYVMVHYVRPVSSGRTEVQCVWLFDPHTMREPDFDASDAVKFWDVTNRQDWHVNELTQLGMQSRAYTPGPYSNAEGLLSAFDAYYMDAMAEP
jgi:glycine betaine catabolism A